MRKIWNLCNCEHVLYFVQYCTSFIFFAILHRFHILCNFEQVSYFVQFCTGFKFCSLQENATSKLEYKTFPKKRPILSRGWHFLRVCSKEKLTYTLLSCFYFDWNQLYVYHMHYISWQNSFYHTSCFYNIIIIVWSIWSKVFLAYHFTKFSKWHILRKTKCY